MITAKAWWKGVHKATLVALLNRRLPPSSLKSGLERIVTIYIGNLSFQATEDDLKDVFMEYGEVTRISLPVDRETGRKRGFAFVEMEDESKEDIAISELDGAEWLGRELRVNKAKPRENNRSKFVRNPLP